MGRSIDEIRRMDESCRRPLKGGGTPCTPENDRPAEGCDADYDSKGRLIRERKGQKRGKWWEVRR